MNILSEKDYRDIREHQQRGERFVLEHVYQPTGYRLTVIVKHSDPETWGQRMIIRVIQDESPVLRMKNCRNIEEVRQYLRT